MIPFPFAYPRKEKEGQRLWLLGEDQSPRRFGSRAGREDVVDEEDLLASKRLSSHDREAFPHFLPYLDPAAGLFHAFRFTEDLGHRKTKETKDFLDVVESSFPIILLMARRRNQGESIEEKAQKEGVFA